MDPQYCQPRHDSRGYKCSEFSRRREGGRTSQSNFDFAESVIGDLDVLVEEGTDIMPPPSPWTPRTLQTDLFALGYEIPDGDSKEAQKRYAAQIFPCLNGIDIDTSLPTAGLPDT